MTKTGTQDTPHSGWKGIRDHWRDDMLSAFSVSLVALPLGLGIAIASGVPPMAGITSAIVGGLLATFFRGGHISINGPTAGLIAVVLTAMAALDDGSGRTFNYVLAVFVVSGALQILLGAFRLGKLAELFPSSVINGILAAIGVIIFSKQAHVALGGDSDGETTMAVLLDIPASILTLNPFVTIISVIGLLLLFFHSKISYKLFHFIPAPLWVLLISIPFVFLFNFFEPHTATFAGRQ